jgi:hypothetical protein
MVLQSTPADEYGPLYELVTAVGADSAWFTVRSDEVPTISESCLEAEPRAMSPGASATDHECASASDRELSSLNLQAELVAAISP